MNSVEVREAVLRAILEHEQGDFQSFQIREELGWSEESPEARRLHAIIQSLKHEGVITQTGTKRKRNQYLKLRHPDSCGDGCGFRRIPRLRTVAQRRWRTLQECHT